MSVRKARRQPKAIPSAQPSLSERLQAAREQLFRVTSIVACCRLAGASKLVEHDPEVSSYALLAAHDLADSVAGSLGELVNEYEGTDESMAGQSCSS